LKDDYSLYKACVINDMTVNLHPIDRPTQGRSVSHEPFVQRCSFNGRLRLDYKGNSFAKKTVEVLFDDVEFQVNENQFCLFIRILDWLLSAYYSTKPLKGAEKKAQETPPPSPPPLQASGKSSDGWGSWMYSFVATDTQKATDSEPKKPTISNSSYSMSAVSVRVSMNATHKTPTPVLIVYFKGCTMKLETVPEDKLFVYTLGIMAVNASVTGLCPCVKKFPTSWRKSNALIPEALEKVSSIRKCLYLKL